MLPTAIRPGNRRHGSRLHRAFDFNSSRHRLWEENVKFAASIAPGAMVLDADAGEAPYKPLLRHARYESADFQRVDKPYAVSTYVCDLAEIPVEDARYDFIIFNQVLEHVPEPGAMLFHRLEVAHKYTARGYPKNYVAIAARPASDGLAATGGLA